MFRVRSLDQEARCERLNSVATIALVVPLVIVGDAFWVQRDWISVAMVGVPALGNLFGVLIRERSVFPLITKSRRSGGGSHEDHAGGQGLPGDPG